MIQVLEPVLPFLDTAIRDVRDGQLCLPYVIVTAAGAIYSGLIAAIIYLYKVGEKRNQWTESRLDKILDHVNSDEKKATG